MPRSTTRARLALLLIILLGFSLRLYHLDDFSFWQDEGLTTLRSSYDVATILGNEIVIQDGVSRDTHPPLFYLIIHLTRRLLGESDFAYRYPSLLCGVLLLPLLFQFGRRLRRRGGARLGLLAALLAAINPMLIWYAQETRMYPLLVLLAAAASYALWRALTLPATGRLTPWLWRYALFAGLALYTHYSMIFLLAAQLLLWASLLWRRGRRRLLLALLTAAALAFVPLIPFTIGRLGVVETNFSYVSPLIILQDVIHGFSLGLTATWGTPATVSLDLAVLLLLLAGLRRANGGGDRPVSARVYLLLYLLAVVAGISLGSLIKPMYQGIRHIMIGSPAFLLLLAQGTLSLPRRPLRLLGLAALLLGPALSLNNQYFNPDFAKDDFRGLVAYVEQMAGDRDVVVYNNAILLPLHEHYRQRDDIVVTALPAYPYWAVREDVAAALTEWSSQTERLWYVTMPPEDGRDAAGMVQHWLYNHLIPMANFTPHTRTVPMSVVGYAVPDYFATVPARQWQPLAQSWAGGLDLVGWTIPLAQPVAYPTLWIDLLWGEGVVPPPTQQIRFQLLDPDGAIWLDQNNAFWSGSRRRLFALYVRQTTFGLALPAGTPPGSYELRLRLWDEATGAEQGDWLSLGPVDLAAADQWPAVPATPDEVPGAITFANGLRLADLSHTILGVRPGHTLPVNIYWEGSAPGADWRYEVEVVAADGSVLRAQSSRPGPDWLAPEAWPASLVREQTGLYFPPDTVPGTYELRWRLYAGAQIVPGRHSGVTAWPFNGDTITFGAVTVEPWPLVTTLPAAEHGLEAAFGPAITLYGVDGGAGPDGVTAVRAGESLNLTLYWQAGAVPDRDYLVFLHLIDPAGSIVSQIDRIPVDWLRPTRGWRAGEVLTDAYFLPIPADLPAGDYQLYAGLYEPDSFIRPVVTWRGQEQPDNSLLLTTVRVE